MDATITSRPYELFAQREMNTLAAKVGTLRAELQIVRCTLISIENHLLDCWQQEELRILIARIDGVLED